MRINFRSALNQLIVSGCEAQERVGYAGMENLTCLSTIALCTGIFAVPILIGGKRSRKKDDSEGGIDTRMKNIMERLEEYEIAGDWQKLINYYKRLTEKDKQYFMVHRPYCEALYATYCAENPETIRVAFEEYQWAFSMLKRYFLHASKTDEPLRSFKDYCCSFFPNEKKMFDFFHHFAQLGIEMEKIGPEDEEVKRWTETTFSMISQMFGDEGDKLLELLRDYRKMLNDPSSISGPYSGYMELSSYFPRGQSDESDLVASILRLSANEPEANDISSIGLLFDKITQPLQIIAEDASVGKYDGKVSLYQLIPALLCSISVMLRENVGISEHVPLILSWMEKNYSLIDNVNNDEMFRCKKSPIELGTIYYLDGVVLNLLGKMDESVGKFMNALKHEIDPIHEVYVLHFLAYKYYLVRKMYSEARNCLMRILKIDAKVEDHATTCHDIAITYGNEGNYQRAIEWMNRAIEKERDSDELLRMRSLLWAHYYLQKPEIGLDSKNVEMMRKDENLFFSFIHSLYHKGRFEDIVSLTDGDRDDDSRMNQLRAMALAGTGRFTEAQALYGLLLQRAEKDEELAQIWYGLGNILFQQMHFSDAAKRFVKALGYNNEPWLAGLAGEAYLKSGNLDEGIRLLKLCAKGDDQNAARSCHKLGAHYEEIGEVEQALFYYGRSKELGYAPANISHDRLSAQKNSFIPEEKSTDVGELVFPIGIRKSKTDNNTRPKEQVPGDKEATIAPTEAKKFFDYIILDDDQRDRVLEILSKLRNQDGSVKSDVLFESLKNKLVGVGFILTKESHWKASPESEKFGCGALTFSLNNRCLSLGSTKDLIKQLSLALAEYQKKSLIGF